MTQQPPHSQGNPDPNWQQGPPPQQFGYPQQGYQPQPPPKKKGGCMKVGLIVLGALTSIHR